MKHDCPNNRATIVNARYVSGCAVCINTRQQSSVYAARFKRESMKRNHRQDVIQRYDGGKINPEWVKMYEDKARQDLGDVEVERILRGV